MRSSLLVLLAVSFVFSTVQASSPPPAGSLAPVDLRGIYVWTALDSKLTSAGGQSVDSALHLPGVDGMLLLGLWATLEPSRGQYNWNGLELWINHAVSLGKKITLVIRAGNAIPTWVFQPAPAGAGAARLVFSISPHEGKTNVCDPDTIAAPWDPAYLARWDSLLTALSAHLKSTGKYNAVTALRLTGINRTSDELRLPAETPQSTGLSCVSDAVTAWQHAGYRPSLLLKGWDSVTSAFQRNFPDKFFSVAIIPNPPQLPFPPIAEDGSVITGTLPDQNQPLLALAAQKFPGHLVVQFNFLLPGQPANPAVISAHQTLGTLVAFQTNNFYSLSDQGAACGGTPDAPVPCSAGPYLQMLETGIYPLGKTDSLRAQYIELWAINANAFPAAVLQAHNELLAGASTGVEAPAGASVLSFALKQNYPNPFNPSTTLTFSLAERIHVRLEIFDLLGRLVRTLVNEELSAGSYGRIWNGEDQTGAHVASGVYLFRLEAGSRVMTRKMSLIQ